MQSRKTTSITTVAVPMEYREGTRGNLLQGGGRKPPAKGWLSTDSGPFGRPFLDRSTDTLRGASGTFILN